MIIRPFVDADLAPAGALLRRAALDFILHESTPKGAREFLAKNGVQGLRANIDAGFVYHAAVMPEPADGQADGQADDALAGFIGVRERSHVFHLFVDQRWQRRGIARRLWETARDAALGPGHPGAFTVNASNHALPFYESLGFVRTAPTQVAAVLYNPMRLAPAPGADSVFAALA